MPVSNPPPFHSHHQENSLQPYSLPSPTPLKVEPTPAQITSADQSPSSKHFSIETKFPVYTIAFTNDTVVVLGGGGGSSRTGVKNRLSMYSIDLPKRQFNLITEHELSKSEDAPMTLAINTQTKEMVTGINSSVEELKVGKNENLRVFTYDDDEGIKFNKKLSTLSSLSEDHYQKITTFSRTSPPSLLALGSTNSQLSLLTYPELKPIDLNLGGVSKGEEGGKEGEGKEGEEKGIYGDEEIYDVDFDDSGEMLMGTSSTKLCIWSTKPPSSGTGTGPQKPLQIIERPNLKKDLTCTFRAAKFGRLSTRSNIYTVINCSPAVRSRKPKAGEKKAFVSLWDKEKWVLVKTRTVSLRPVTAFDVSPDGSLLAFGSSDLSVGILNASTLQSIMTVLRAHDFPVTSLSFNPSATLVISGSADNTVRVINVPPVSERGAGSWVQNVLVTILIVLIAILIQQSQVGAEVRRVALEALHFG